MTELYIKHNKNAVPIDADFDSQRKRRDSPLKTVGHVIAAYKAAVTPDLDGVSINNLTLHLPEGVARSSSGLSEDCFATMDENDTTLDSGCPLSSLAAFGSKSKQPLIIKAETSPTNSLSNLSVGDAIEFTHSEINLELNGINLNSPHLNRKDLLTSIVGYLSTHRFVILSSPAGSGKTSLLQLLRRLAINSNIKCVYNRTTAGSFCAEVLRKASIDMNAKSCGYSADDVTYILIDDAQNSFDDNAGWESFLKEPAGPDCWLPSSVKFIIASTHSLKGGFLSPAGFTSLPTLSRKDFLVNNAEALGFLQSEIGLRHDMQFDSLRQTIIHQCGGLVGALRLSVDSLTSSFPKSSPTENESLLFYLSAIVVAKMERLFGSDHAFPINEEFKTFLATCFTSGFTRSPVGLRTDDEQIILRLQKAGILVEDAGLIGFSSVMAQRYFIQWLFPHRSSTQPESLSALLKSSIQNMSRSLLVQSVVDGFPKEATFQHLLMEGLAKFTPPECSICPELLKVFPDGNQTGGLVSGDIDFYLNGPLRWGIELLVLGHGIGEHIDRFGPGGKYFKLAVNDYAVVDFRVSPDELKLTNVHSSARINHAFNEVATTLIWQTPRFKTLASFQTFTNICKDTTNHQHASSQIKRLDLTRPVHLRDFVNSLHIAFIMEPAPRLVHVNLSHCQTTDASIAQLLVSSSATLQSLDVSYCRQLTDAAGLLIAGFCGEYARLRVLKMHGCGLIGDATLVELGNQVTASLEVLDVSSCPRVTDRGIFRFLDKAVRKEVERRREVRKKVYGLGMGSRWRGSVLPKERVVDGKRELEYDVEMDKEDVGLVIQQKLEKQSEVDHGYDRVLGRLKEFRFSGNQTSSRKLTWIDLERILACLLKGNAISTVEFSIPPPSKKITSLHIYNASTLHPDSIHLISTTIGKYLIELSLTPTTHCTSAIIHSLLSNVVKVKKLRLSYSRIDASTIRHLIDACESSKTLEEVDFGFNRSITDLALFLMTEITEGGMVLQLPRLKSLSLAGCTNVTVEGILPLIQMYASSPAGTLRCLDITGAGVDWKAWRQIVSQCEGFDESMKRQTGFERYLPEHIGVDEDSFDKEYVFGNRRGMKEDVDVWVPVHRGVNAGGVDSDSEDTENAEATEAKVFTLKDAKTAEIVHASTLVSIAKYYGIK
ncbi:UNVERIFIED_CONTAM: hypothetical protein HDU68_011515 [Siphonaria sp. JEL0065]|nr:hypothetical protein HDU68_011515 [Siphonaria sp. JEL0065]